MRNKAPAVLWIITAVLYIFFALKWYWDYSTPRILWFVIFPETWATNWLIIGTISLFIGIGLIRQPQKVIGLIFSFPIWLLLLTLMSFIFEIIQHDRYRGWSDCLFDYFIIIPFIVSVSVIKKENIIQTSRAIIDHYKKKWLTIVIQSIAIFTIIQLLAWFVPYDTFNFIHE